MSSTDPDYADTYTLTIDNSATFYGLAATEVFDSTLSFDFTVTDPCVTTVYTAFTLDDMTLEAGQTLEQEYDEPTHSAGTAVSD